MNAVRRPGQPTTGEVTTDRGIRLRLLAAVVAILAGVAALVVGLLLVRSVLA